MTDAVEGRVLSPLRRQLAFQLLLLGAFMPSFGMFAATIALPAVREALGASPAEASLVISGYSSAYAVCLVTGGRLGDLFGRRRMFLIGMAGFTLMSLLCGFAPNILWLISCRVLQGVFASVMAPPVLASIRSLFSADEVPWALNVYGTGIGVAVAAGQFLGGVLVSIDAWGLGWRSAFLVNVPLGVFALALAPFFVPESEGHERPRLDYGGVVLLSAALACLVVPLSIGRNAGWAPWVLALIAASPVLALAFFTFERALARAGGMPILDASLLRIVRFRRGLLVAMLFFFTSPFYLYFSVYLQAGMHASPIAAGLAVLPYGIANFVGPILATRLPASARPWLFGVGMGLEVLGYAGIAVSAAFQWQGWPLYTIVFIAGFGQGVAMPEMFNTILGDVPRQFGGLAAGMMNSTLQLGASISVAALGSVFFAVLGDGVGPAAYGHALAVTMAGQVAMLALSMVLGLRNAR